jgi:hypothetical protein
MCGSSSAIEGDVGAGVIAGQLGRKIRWVNPGNELPSKRESRDDMA